MFSQEENLKKYNKGSTYILPNQKPVLSKLNFVVSEYTLTS